MSKRVLVALAVLATVAWLPNTVLARGPEPLGDDGDHGDDGDDDGDDHDGCGKDKPVCYAWDIFPNERFRLDVEKHSKLSTRAEREAFGHAKQTAHSVHGKEIGGCGEGTTMALTGTVITARTKHDTTAPVGARMGFEVHAARSAPLECRSITLDCSSPEESATPDVWNCESRNEFDISHGPSTLTKVDASLDPLCSTFEAPTGGGDDGDDDDTSNRQLKAAKGKAKPAGGLRMKLPKRR
jgi:hypothetical protein